MVPALDTTRLLYIVDHPIQYQAPLLQCLAAEPALDLKVAFRHLGGADTQFANPDSAIWLQRMAQISPR